jgi:hypothetical protein
MIIGNHGAVREAPVSGGQPAGGGRGEHDGGHYEGGLQHQHGQPPLDVGPVQAHPPTNPLKSSFFCFLIGWWWFDSLLIKCVGIHV